MNKNFNVLYIGKHFKITDHNGIVYRITNITSTSITIDDCLVLTYEQFKKEFNVEKIVVY
jgi:hypothetical protein